MQPADHSLSPVYITLVPGFRLSVDNVPSDIGLPATLLALNPEPMERAAVAGKLWPDVTELRAGANLRTGLWRINQLCKRLISADGSRLRLCDQVAIDLVDLQRLAHRVLGREDVGNLVSTGGDERVDVQRLIRSFTHELLAGWYEDWLDVHQERWRQLRLHALDTLAMLFTELGLFAAAIDAATSAVAAEPLRESGYRALMSAHLAEGNIAEAVRTHEQYRRVLERELGVSPSLQMYELMSRATGAASSRGRRRSDRSDATCAVFSSPDTPERSGSEQLAQDAANRRPWT